MFSTEQAALELPRASSPIRRPWAEDPLCALSVERQNNQQRLCALERQRQKLGGKELPLQPAKVLKCLELAISELRDCGDELAQALQNHLEGAAATDLLSANSLKRRKAHELAESLVAACRQEQLNSRVD